MKAEMKADWIAALRSGEFRQTTGTLRQRSPEGDSHCCLGVLACVPLVF